MPAAIEVSNLLFEYPGVRALDDVSFSIAERTVTALVGPNGAGKTTLLRCLAGLEIPLAGKMSIAGIDVLEEPRAVHRRIGYLSDFYGLYDALSVRQCFAHAASACGVPASGLAAAVERTAHRLGLEALLERRAAELSRGQRQRVAIGQALIHDPQVLMLDEPASGLDPEARHALAGLFTRLRGEGMTLLVSSHILAELDEYSTHMLVMREGRILDARPIAGHAAGAQDAPDAAAAGAPAAVRGVQVLFSREIPDLGNILDSLTGLRVLEVRGRVARVEVPDTDEAQAEALRTMVLAGLAVSACWPERENFQESYLRTMARDEAGAKAR